MRSFALLDLLLLLMPATHFDAPLLMQALHATSIVLADTPYFYNDAGQPRYVSQLPAGAQTLTPRPNDPSLEAGHAYTVQGIRSSSTSAYGSTCELDIAGHTLHYAPLWLSTQTAAAFGMTAVGPGQGLRIESSTPVLQHMHYAYGVFAGHWSPYQNTQNRLLPITCTDLEHHAFPHIFASTDACKPLVISVARYWPAQKIIRLADLWIPKGWCVYLPAQPGADGATCINMHNNRNAARACWGDIQQDRIHTQTLLSETGYFHWYWNALPTIHSAPTFENKEVLRDAHHTCSAQ